MCSTAKADVSPDSIRLVLLDIDGTVFRRTEACPGAAQAIQRITEAGRVIRYLTNNSTAQPTVLDAQLLHAGIPSDSSWVFTAGMAAARYAKSQGIDRCAVVGEAGLFDQIEAAGLDVSPLGDPAPCLIAGLCREFDYEMLRRAADTVRSEAMLIGCNPDTTYPIENDRLAPGAGAIIAAIEAASGVKATVVGKPKPELALAACESAGIGPEATLLAGDRIDTDIACGRAAGMATWLVLTGVTRALPPGEPGSDDLRGLADWLTRS